MTSRVFDLIVIGGGPNGLACAIEAIKNNVSVLVIEKGTIAESIRRYPHQMTFFSTADNIGIGNVPFTIDKPKATREEALNYYRRVVEFYQIPLALYTKAETIFQHENKFTIHTSTQKTFESQYLVLSTGYFDFPRKLDIPGEELSHVKKYYDEPYPYATQKVAIIGAGNSAVEAALDLYRHGAEVTLIVRGETMKKTAKYWLLPDLMNRIKEERIKAYFNHKAIAIRDRELTIKDLKSGIDKSLEADYIFILAGYLPDVDFMKKCGIDVEEDTLAPVFDKDTFETNVKNLYVAGTLTAGIRTEKVFIENGRLHGAAIIADIIQKRIKI